jgi:cation diffusion facilitator family transporter
MIADRAQKIIRASWIGIAGNGLLAAAKIVFGIISSSLAVVSDGVDSATDILTSIITLFTAHILRKPPDPKFPYGYARAETLATKVLSFIIFFSGAQLIIQTIGRIINHEDIEAPEPLALYITIISIAGKIFLAVYKMRIGKSTESSMLIADAKNMRNDIVISLLVLIGLFFTKVLEIPLLDSITALLVSIWIIKVALEIFFETNVELMDGIGDRKIYQKVFSIIDSIPEAGNPHKARIRKIGNMYAMVIDIEMDGNKTVNEAHRISQRIEAAIKAEIEHIYDITVHTEPAGHEEKGESYGLNRDNIDT